MTTSNNELALTPSDSVRLVQNQDGAVLLDIRQGLCLSMTSVGVQIWELLKLKSSVGHIVETLVADFHVPRQQIHDDVMAFIGDLRDKRLLVTNVFSKRRRLPTISNLILIGHRNFQRRFSRPGTVVHFLSWKAFLALLAFDLLRFGENFSRMHEFVQNWTVAPGPITPDSVQRVTQALNWACVWYPKKVLCLQRSSVLTCLLRSCGVGAQMVMGAQKFPFKAHAWTEVDGRAINERKDVQSLYLVWEHC
jgi:hypothetical protein